LEIGYASTRGATGLLNRRKIIIEQSKVFWQHLHFVMSVFFRSFWLALFEHLTVSLVNCMLYSITYFGCPQLTFSGSLPCVQYYILWRIYPVLFPALCVSWHSVPSKHLIVPTESPWFLWRSIEASRGHNEETLASIFLSDLAGFGTTRPDVWTHFHATSWWRQDVLMQHSLYVLHHIPN
jgi:hypothetical protein